MRASRIAEEQGIPAVAIVATGFLGQARLMAQALGVENATIVEYPGVIPMDTPEVLEAKVSSRILPDVLEGLAGAGGTESAVATAARAEPAPDSVVLRGTLDEILDDFHARQWTDGLPIVPPTPERVAAFLGMTDRDPDDVLGVLAPEMRQATVRSVAVNGVMAGCRPEYMPILVAGVEALADPAFRIQDAGSTPGWEPLMVVSGPLVASLGFNTKGGLMRVGRQANASIGRFLRLYMRNVAGFRVPPGGTDKGSIGYTFNVAMAEDDEVVSSLGWPPFRVDQGFSHGDTVVTVQSVVAISPPVYSGGSDPLELSETLLHYFAGTAGAWAFTGVWYGRYHPLILMSPAVAAAYAAAGWGKPEIRHHLYENLRISARWLEHYPFHVAGQDVPLADLVQRGVAQPRYAESDDPERQVPLLQREDWTNIVVAGDPGRNQSRIYINNHEQGPPISKRVLPRD